MVKPSLRGRDFVFVDPKNKISYLEKMLLRYFFVTNLLCDSSNRIRDIRVLKKKIKNRERERLSHAWPRIDLYLVFLSNNCIIPTIAEWFDI